MEQQQSRPDHVVVDIELQPDNVAGAAPSQRNAAVDVAKPLPTHNVTDCGVVDMNLLQAASVVGDPAGSPDHHIAAAAAAKPEGTNCGGDDDDGSGCCVVCTEPLEWVVVGRCGHRVVCSRCMVRIRFFHQNKRCCICRTRCPKVLVARWGGAAGDLSALPRFAFREGRVGKHWYHKHTAAYFEDEQQYDVARAACHGILSPFYRPLFCFLHLFGSALLIGAAMGYGFAGQAKQRSLQVIAYSLTIFGALLVVTIIWTSVKCAQDPLHIESYRKVDESTLTD